MVKKNGNEKPEDDLKEKLDKILEQDKLYAENSVMFLNTVRQFLDREIDNADLPKELLVYLLQRELLAVFKKMLPNYPSNASLVILFEALADTLRDELYGGITVDTKSKLN